MASDPAVFDLVSVGYVMAKPGHWLRRTRIDKRFRSVRRAYTNKA